MAGPHCLVLQNTPLCVQVFAEAVGVVQIDVVGIVHGDRLRVIVADALNRRPPGLSMYGQVAIFALGYCLVLILFFYLVYVLVLVPVLTRYCKLCTSLETR